MAEAILAYAVASLEELNHALQEQADTGDQDDRKTRILNRITVDIETFLDRQLVTRGSLVEFHSPSAHQRDLYLAEYPVTAVASVYEDTAWQGLATADRYAAGTLLVVGTDYLALMPTREPSPYGRLMRVNKAWGVGRRVIKVTYTAGYANTAAVPKAIKDVALEWASIMWREQSNKEVGLISRSDAGGSMSRFAPSILTESRKARLIAYKRLGFEETWERDAA